MHTKRDEILENLIVEILSKVNVWESRINKRATQWDHTNKKILPNALFALTPEYVSDIFKQRLIDIGTKIYNRECLDLQTAADDVTSPMALAFAIKHNQEIDSRKIKFEHGDTLDSFIEKHVTTEIIYKLLDELMEWD
ncbi:MAG: hypothetical protein AAGA35_03075 [Patescibacteria group bacterium]